MDRLIATICTCLAILTALSAAVTDHLPTRLTCVGITLILVIIAGAIVNYHHIACERQKNRLPL